MANVSSDLVWQLTRNQNAFLVKRSSAGGVQFSRDPLNPTNYHSRKYAGYANEKALSLQPGETGGVVLIAKNASNTQNPAKNIRTTSYGPNTSNRKIYKSVASSTAKNGYRADLREAAVARVSAIRRSQKPKKETPAPKLRGAKAKKAAESE
ncbi:60S ribosomal protein L28 [Talaromyces proteolyticus]|uniref:60S ribosomal protein L28 n=1 Tax=Talaromyces proteolyticus TaxID=1131652 RepID=A0AAD4KEH5_9EURO|nr:60S ribosomal protein L28 [Talaromyces proteolyticus]KAH8689703.1 60S ribosomal protein L28 [Talaromyces proteolyticus]